MPEPLDNPDPIVSRLQRLEEAQAFADHTISAVSDEVRGLGRKLAALEARLRRLEGQLARLQTPPEEPSDNE